MNADVLVEKYIMLRDKVKDLNKQHKENIAKYTDVMTAIEAQLGKVLNDAGVESMRAKTGTFFKAKKDFVSVSDWDAVLAYSQEHGDYEMFNKAVKKDYCKNYMEENEGAQLPGTEYGVKFEIQVRGPTK